MVLFSVYIEIGMKTANISYLWYICSNLVDYDMYYMYIHTFYVYTYVSI